MRLQLIAAALAFAFTPRARADEPARSGTATLRVYADDDHVTVVSPTTTAVVPVTSDVVVDGEVAADAVTAASVDVITAASPGTVHELRIEAAAGVTDAVTHTAAIGARAIVSHEHDYDSVHGSAHGRVELADRNLTLDGVVDLGFEAASSVTDASFHAHRRTQRAIATFTQILDHRTYVDLIIDGERLYGYHASPYRTVPLVDAMEPIVTRVSEATPALRLQLAGALRVRRALTVRSALHAGYRLYFDDWGIVSHTATASLVADRHRARAGLGARFYAQSGASFYREAYALLPDGSVPALRTRDRTLGPMDTLALMLTGDLATTDRGDRGPRVIAELAAMEMWFFEFAPQRQRAAITTTVGVAAPF